MDLELTGKVAIVTGGTRGIGAAISRRLLLEGAKVVVGSRTELDIEQIVQELSPLGNIEGYVLDVADSGSTSSFVEKVIKRFERIDILVNNAGVNRRLPALGYPEEEFSRILNVNLTGVYRMCQDVGKHMVERRYGKIINITSIMSHTVAPYQSAYVAAKGALAQYTKLLAVEWGGYNINVNAVSPGFIETDLTEKALSDEQFRGAILAQTPTNKLGLPENVADAAAFLASERATFIQGHLLAVDGGFLSGFPTIMPPAL